MSMAVSSTRPALGDIGRENNLLRVLAHDGRRQFRVRFDVRVRLICGLAAPLTK
jgi:hypothetical protein